MAATATIKKPSAFAHMLKGCCVYFRKKPISCEGYFRRQVEQEGGGWSVYTINRGWSLQPGKGQFSFTGCPRPGQPVFRRAAKNCAMFFRQREPKVSTATAMVYEWHDITILCWFTWPSSGCVVKRSTCRHARRHPEVVWSDDQTDSVSRRCNVRRTESAPSDKMPAAGTPIIHNPTGLRVNVNRIRNILKDNKKGEPKHKLPLTHCGIFQLPSTWYRWKTKTFLLCAYFSFARREICWTAFRALTFSGRKALVAFWAHRKHFFLWGFRQKSFLSHPVV